MFGVHCVSCSRMESSYCLCMVPLTLAVIVIFPSPTAAYKSSSFDHDVYTVPGQFNLSYELNISRTAPVSILYNQSHHQVIAFLC